MLNGKDVRRSRILILIKLQGLSVMLQEGTQQQLILALRTYPNIKNIIPNRLIVILNAKLLVLHVLQVLAHVLLVSVKVGM